MRRPTSVKALEELGRVQLSEHFFMRDFLYSEIGAIHALPNIPDDPDLAIAAGRRLCTELLEPLEATFGRIAVRSAYRSAALNDFGNRHKLNCARNAVSRADHIWDRRDEDGLMGATCCIVVPWFTNRFSGEGEWRRLAWFIHDHLPYSRMTFFPKLFAFNLSWHERPQRRIDSFAAPKGLLAKPGMANAAGSHAADYAGFPPFRTASP